MKLNQFIFSLLEAAVQVKVTLLKQYTIQQPKRLDILHYPSDSLHIWAENAPVNEHSEIKLETIQTQRYILKATDLYPKNVNKQDIDRVLARGRAI